MVTRSLIALVAAVVCFGASAQSLRVGHMGIAAHDIILRKLTQGSDITVVSVPGGRGVVAYDALDRGKIDFLAVSSGAVFANPVLYPDVLSFDPTDRYALISLVSSAAAVAVLPKHHKSIDDLAHAKCKTNNVVFVASIGGTEHLFAREMLPKRGCSVQVVQYANQEAPFLDVVSGRIDMVLAAEVAAIKYQDSATLVYMKDSRSDVLKSFSYDTVLLARKDVAAEHVRRLLELFSANAGTDDVVTWQKSTRTRIRLITGIDAALEAKKTRSVYRELLRQDKTTP